MLAQRSLPTVSRAATAAGPRPAPRARPAAPRALAPELAALAAAGDVDAPIGVVIGGAILITLVATAIVPLALKPGDDAAQKIFAAKQKNPLDSKKNATGKGKGRK